MLYTRKSKTVNSAAIDERCKRKQDLTRYINRSFQYLHSNTRLIPFLPDVKECNKYPFVLNDQPCLQKE
jgi:hypothetical protein